VVSGLCLIVVMVHVYSYCSLYLIHVFVWCCLALHLRCLNGIGRGWVDSPYLTSLMTMHEARHGDFKGSNQTYIYLASNHRLDHVVF